MKKPELLAPAGNLQKLKYAFVFGADAVYCGIPDFSLRARINDFTEKTLKEGIDYAHSLDKRVYVTINIFAHEKHLVKLKKHILILKKLKPDAVIVSDPGIIALVKSVWHDAEIHLSTQANCTNSSAARFWLQQGVASVNIGREATLAEIAQIHKELKSLRMEIFVHGAMCMAYSGRCLLSKYFTGRSANSGDCTQSCRWKYRVKTSNNQHPTTNIAKTPLCHPELAEGDIDFASQTYYLEEFQRPGELLEIDEDYHGSYIMNSKDLCLVEYLDKLMAAGVASFKIEGRAKSIYYLGNTVKVYRDAIDALSAKKKFSKKKAVEELKKSQNRGFTSGFIFGAEKCEQKVDASHEKNDWEFCGEVVSSEDGLIKVRVHNMLQVGDQLELVVPGAPNQKLVVKTILDKDKQKIKEAHGGQDLMVYLSYTKKVPNMTLLRKKLN